MYMILQVNIRKENITKENFRFSEYYYIEDNIDYVFNKIKIDELKKLSFDELIKKLSGNYDRFKRFTSI